MKGNGKHLVKRVAATAAVAGTLSLGGLMTAGVASAETVDNSGPAVLTNVTPDAVSDAYTSNVSCCQSQQTNFGCC
ncbi:hypothetical protein BZB76_1124 [Actinomadura pelletieri DSM 43383]|uniref:Uncharacterized protein n=1 Tax=Actinomadura pelletieri DSM 43383 TaxID=1120940 RepID=A0A495QZJ8_9ACTN|nr:hypothetical protein [Actinomadura pelletieri]RKS79649.1 hypothetical protein BZB76_1124 [Actinomadura pelletieri DSM 43383]